MSGLADLQAFFNMKNAGFKSGTLADGTAFAIDVQNCRCPATITLKSAAGGRQIELSTDGGVEYFVQTPDKTTATMLIVFVTQPISHVRITGAASDTWSVR